MLNTKTCKTTVQSFLQKKKQIREAITTYPTNQPKSNNIIVKITIYQLKTTLLFIIRERLFPLYLWNTKIQNFLPILC